MKPYYKKFVSFGIIWLNGIVAVTIIELVFCVLKL